MANTCKAQVQACAIRVARLDASGVPDPGGSNLYVADTLSELTANPEFEEGDEFIVKNACGSPCVNFKDDDKFKRLAITLGLCKPDPELEELMAGGKVLTSGAAVGYAMPPIGIVDNPNGISIELWAKRIEADGSLDADFPYEWYVLPRVKLRWGNRTFNNGPITVAFQGNAFENPNWFDGPLNDWVVDSDRVLQHMPTTTLPTADCGYQELIAS